MVNYQSIQIVEEWDTFIAPVKIWFFYLPCFARRFLHPIIYGEYPKTVQEIVKERLPRFTEEEVKMVQGSIDYVGINQYTTYYMYDPRQPEPEKPISYADDWHAGFACEWSMTSFGMLKPLNIL